MVVRLSLHQFRLRHILQSENAPLFTQVTPNTKHTINSKVTDSNAINRNQQQFFTSESTAHKLQPQPTDPWHQRSEQLNFRIFTFSIADRPSATLSVSTPHFTATAINSNSQPIFGFNRASNSFAAEWAVHFLQQTRMYKYGQSRKWALTDRSSALLSTVNKDSSWPTFSSGLSYLIRLQFLIFCNQ